jgi:hypothetical protein
MTKLKKKSATLGAVKYHKEKFDDGDAVAAWYALRELSGKHGSKSKTPRWLRHYLETVAIAVQAVATREGGRSMLDGDGMAIVVAAMGLGEPPEDVLADLLLESATPGAKWLLQELAKRLIDDAGRRGAIAARKRAAGPHAVIALPDLATVN